MCTFHLNENFFCNFLTHICSVSFFAEARGSTYALDQERQFEQIIEALENVQSQGQNVGLLDVEPEVEAFVNGLAYSLQKTSGQQYERLFIDIHQLVYDTLFPCRATAPRPQRQ